MSVGATIWLAVADLLAGCSGMGATTFLHRDFNFGFIERVAVVPFENLTRDQGAGFRTTRYFVSELLAAEAFDVVEPGEVARALEKHGEVRTAQLTQAQVIEIGKDLNVQGIILGSISESTTTRSGSGNFSVVTLVVRMLETEKGTTVWSTTHTEGGRGFWSALFGTGGKSLSEVTRQCIERSVKTLIK